MIFKSDCSSEIESFCGVGFQIGKKQSATLVLEARGNIDWRIKQEASLGLYATQHVERKINNESLAIYRLFGSYINAAAYKTKRENPMILDVGCGIFPLLSPALETVDNRCQYVGLDPLNVNIEREYGFVLGRIEDLAALDNFKLRFDIFVFGTSLDHLEDIPRAAAAVRHLASPGALLVCWNGLHEAERAIAEHGVAVFKRLLQFSSILTAVIAYLGYGIVRLPRLLNQMHAIDNAIKESEVLDHHCRWFTESNSPQYLSAFGDVIDVISIPNTQHSFATVRIK